MSERRFYTEPALVDPGQSVLFLPEEETHHAVRVLRLQEGDEISVIDGNYVYQGVIASVKDRRASVSIVSKKPATTPKPSITLVQAVPKGKKADFIVEKAVEMGVDSVIFVKSERSVSPVSAGKLERWRKIALAAAKQSKRDTIANIEVADGFEIVPVDDDTTGFVLHPEADQSLDGLSPAQINRTGRIILYVGPEGGFSGSEIEALKNHRYLPVRFKTPVLRTETAPIVALSVIMFLAGRL